MNGRFYRPRDDLAFEYYEFPRDGRLTHHNNERRPRRFSTTPYTPYPHTRRGRWMVRTTTAEHLSDVFGRSDGLSQ